MNNPVAKLILYINYTMTLSKIQYGHFGQKRVLIISVLSIYAEREGFEPPEPLSSTVFKTAAIDHSAISPF